MNGDSTVTAKWHDLESARAEWQYAPKDDLVLQNLLDTSQQECIIAANDPDYTSRPL